MGGPRGPLYPSAGPLPSGRALSAISQEQIRKAYYETSQNRGLPGRQPCQEIVGENYLTVHCIGQRDTRYLKWEHNKAPLTNRLATRHAQSYVPLPLGDNVVNRGLAANFKAGTQTNKAGSLAPMDGNTKQEDDYPERSIEYEIDRIQRAYQKNQKPKQTLTSTVCPPGDLLERVSHEQRWYQVPRADLAKAEKAPQPRPGLEQGGAPLDVKSTTAYTREFGKQAMHMLSKTASAPQLFATAHEKEQSKALNLNVGSFKRAPYLSPGG
eukprot:TRINITY_DN54091_c0_g1_i1.p1 TRINITY_DN54091_c0_g1~~TRINITY_DN54091_c0_g1_i1.p1  ORF type:complete len:268 (-),score=44.08 TRINITY_DN54091_c0_g1_i1:483-1286(-)